LPNDRTRDTQKHRVRRNFAALAGDFVLFSIGFAFYDPFVVVPAFVKEFTGSELMVGVLSALRTLMITLPQVWAASVLVARPQKKPLLIWSSVGGRLPVLLLAVVTLIWAADAPWFVAGVLAFSVVVFYVSEGLNSISWPALMGKVIPGDVRGRFLGFSQLLSSLGALGAGYVVRLILSDGGSSDPGRWAMLFACSFVGLMLSVLSMSFVREEAEVPATTHVAVGRSIQMMFGYLRANGWLRRVVAAQFLLGTAGAAFPFFVVHACEVVPGGEQAIGLFLIMQNLGGVAAALICGQLIDHVGSWASIRLVTVMQVAALLAASLASWGIPQALYLGAFFLLAFAGSSSWWSFSAYLLDMAADEQRPIYLAASGVLTSPTFLGSIVVGGLLEVMAFEVVFVAALVLSCVGLALAWTIPQARVSAAVHEGATVAS
jgi:MFS family permease